MITSKELSGFGYDLDQESVRVFVRRINLRVAGRRVSGVDWYEVINWKDFKECSPIKN